MNGLEVEPLQPAAAPIDMLEHYFGVHGWASERNGDEEIVATIDGSWTQYQLRALWREEEGVLQLVALPDLQVPDDRRAAMWETLGRINEQLWMGHFEMWSADGTLLFRHATALEADEDTGLSMAQAEIIVEAALDECERYFPVFQFVIFGGKSPTEAIAAALIDTMGEA